MQREEHTRPGDRRTRRSRRLGAALAAALAVAALAPAPAAARQALTLWWVIFNNPDACGEGCGAEDFANPEVGASVVYASGQFARPNGFVRLVASLYEQAPGFADELVAGPGLVDAEKAEIHLVVRSHGRRLARERLQQITRFLDPGCEELGGGNPCRDIQFAVHAPGEETSESRVFWFPGLGGGGAVPNAESHLFRDAGGVKVVLETRVK